MKVSFEGIGESVATFYVKAEETVAGGQPVKLSGNGEICGCGDGERFFGMALAGDGDFAAVQMAGFAEFAYSGVKPDAGFVKLVANGSGGVKIGEAGGEYLVIEVDEANGVLGLVL